MVRFKVQRGTTQNVRSNHQSPEAWSIQVTVGRGSEERASVVQLVKLLGVTPYEIRVRVHIFSYLLDKTSAKNTHKSSRPLSNLRRPVPNKILISSYHNVIELPKLRQTAWVVWLFNISSFTIYLCTMMYLDVPRQTTNAKVRPTSCTTRSLRALCSTRSRRERSLIALMRASDSKIKFFYNIWAWSFSLS